MKTELDDVVQLVKSVRDLSPTAQKMVLQALTELNGSEPAPVPGQIITSRRQSNWSKGARSYWYSMTPRQRKMEMRRRMRKARR